MDGVRGRGSSGFVITGDLSTTALDPGVWCSTACKESCRFMAAWVREVGNVSKPGRKRERQKRWTRLRSYRGWP